MNSPRIVRIEALKNTIGTSDVTLKIKELLARYETMSDEEYDLGMIAARKASVARMASDLFAKMGK